MRACLLCAPLPWHFPILHYVRHCKGLPCLLPSSRFGELAALRMLHTRHQHFLLQLCPLWSFSSYHNYDNSPVFEYFFSDVYCQNVTFAPPTRTTYKTDYRNFDIYIFVLAGYFFFQPIPDIVMLINMLQTLHQNFHLQP